MKGVLTRRLLLGLAAVGAVIGGAIAIPPSLAIAGFGGGTTVLAAVTMRRLAPASVACAGTCLVRATEDDDTRTCPLRPLPQATYAACLTTLNGLCTNACKTTP